MDAYGCCFEVLERACSLLLLLLRVTLRRAVVCLLRSVLSTLGLWGADLSGWWCAAWVGEVVAIAWTRGVVVVVGAAVSLGADVVIGLDGRRLPSLLLLRLLLRRLWASLSDGVFGWDIGAVLLAAYFGHFCLVAAGADAWIELVGEIACVWA